MRREGVIELNGYCKDRGCAAFCNIICFCLRLVSKHPLWSPLPLSIPGSTLQLRMSTCTVGSLHMPKHMGRPTCRSWGPFIGIGITNGAVRPAQCAVEALPDVTSSCSS